MTTYTIAYDAFADILWGCVPDGSDIEKDISATENASVGELCDRDNLTIARGLTLTDEVEDGDDIVWQGNVGGWLTDENGTSYRYAVER